MLKDDAASHFHFHSARIALTYCQSDQTGMAMQLDRIKDESGSNSTAGGAERRRIDVSDLDAIGVDTFVRERVGTDRVSLEHRGSRTYLLVEE